METNLKFPQPKKIDWTKFIEPMYQDFETNKTGASIAILKPINQLKNL